ncbi:MAG: biopolymer transporter ExbD [Verrucomicrobia subdivision 3 bacterium]|nr:biopolymer transporter ExbD [Limisphaerales bacterium]
MRRFSQRNSLVTLSDINITPLLDLAFVLLIIFVITTPLLEQGLSLKLPTGDVVDDRKIDPKDIKTIEVSIHGKYMMGGRWMELDQISALLMQEHKRNPKILVYLRADENGPYKHVAAILNRLELAGIDQVSLRTTPKTR